MQIRLLRQLGLSLEEIRAVQQTELSEARISCLEERRQIDSEQYTAG